MFFPSMLAHLKLKYFIGPFVCDIKRCFGKSGPSLEIMFCIEVLIFNVFQYVSPRSKIFCSLYILHVNLYFSNVLVLRLGFISIPCLRIKCISLDIPFIRFFTKVGTNGKRLKHIKPQQTFLHTSKGSIFPVEFIFVERFEQLLTVGFYSTSLHFTSH